MISRRLASCFLVLVIVAVVLASAIFWTVVTGTSADAWKNAGYSSAFILGLVGSASVFIPIPTTVALLAISAGRIFDPTILAVSFGLGAAVGQLTSYAVGCAACMVVDEKRKRRLSAMAEIFSKYGMIAMFIFALTPLPDSLILIPMGMIRYSLWRVFVATAAGKIVMSLIITYVGGAVGQVAENWVFGAITVVLLVLVVIVMFRIDWEKLVDKYLPKKKKGARRKRLVK